MAEKHLVWAIVVLAVFFWGDYDIADAIIHFLTGGGVSGRG